MPSPKKKAERFLPTFGAVRWVTESQSWNGKLACDPALKKDEMLKDSLPVVPGRVLPLGTAFLTGY